MVRQERQKRMNPEGPTSVAVAVDERGGIRAVGTLVVQYSVSVY